MTKYYLNINHVEMGPYSAKEVRNMNIGDSALVRIDGSKVWLDASCFNFERLMVQEVLEESRMKVQHGELDELPRSVGDVEARRWNWGACFMPCFWGLFNGVYWPLLIVVFHFVPIVYPIMRLALMIVMGIKGGQWAWKRNKWENVEQYITVQHRWAIVGICYFIARLGFELIFWLW